MDKMRGWLPSSPVGASMLLNLPKAKCTKSISRRDTNRQHLIRDGANEVIVHRTATNAVSAEVKMVVGVHTHIRVAAEATGTIRPLAMTKNRDRESMARTGTKPTKRPKHVPLRTCIA